MKHNLPARRLFFNRRKEIDEIRRALGDRASRVLTITGAPGVGKTALALEIAWRETARDRFAGVVWLNGFTSAREALTQIGTVLVLVPASPARVRAHLAEHPCLVVFDALTASEAALEFVNTIASVETKVLVAGERLNLVGSELVWELGALPQVPPAFATLAALWDASENEAQRQALPLQTRELNADVIETARTLARDYTGDGENETASSLLEIARRVAQQIQDKKLESSCLTDIGLIYKNRGDWAKSLEYHEQALALDRVLGDKQGEAVQLGNVGNVYQLTGNLGRALDYYEQSLTLDREMGYIQGEAANLSNIGLVCQTQGDLDKALEYLEQSLALHRELGYKQGEAANLGNIGLICQAQGDLDKAFEYFEQSLALHRELGNKLGEASNLISIGNTYRLKSDFDKALQYYEQSLALARELGNRREEAISLGSMGGIYRVQGNLDKALEYHEQALALDRELGYKLGEASTLSNSGLICQDRGDLDKALEYFEQSLALHRELGHKQGEASQLNNIGLIYQNQGNLDRALEYHEQALALDRALGNKYGEASNVGNIGSVYRLKGDLDKALRFYAQSLALHRELGDRQGEAILLGNIGVIYRARSDPDKALEYHEQALALDHELGYKQGETSALGNIGLIYLDKGDSGKALEYLEQSLALHRELGYKQGEANQLGNIGLIYRNRGDLDKALEYFVSALGIRGITADAQRIIQNHIARIREKIGELEFDALWERVTSRLQHRFNALESAKQAEAEQKFDDAAQALADACATYDTSKLDAFEWREYAQLGWRRAIALKQAGDLIPALDALQQTFKEFKRAGDDNVLGRICLEMGHVARALDTYEDAWIHYGDAYRLFKRIGNKRMMAVAREEIGTLEFFFRVPEARANLEEAYQLYTETGERVRARTVEQILREAQTDYTMHPDGGKG